MSVLVTCLQPVEFYFLPCTRQWHVQGGELEFFQVAQQSTGAVNRSPACCCCCNPPAIAKIQKYSCTGTTGSCMLPLWSHIRNLTVLHRKGTSLCFMIHCDDAECSRPLRCSVAKTLLQRQTTQFAAATASSRNFHCLIEASHFIDVVYTQRER